MVVVTRWFGGIKLGVGGLIRAYGGCAAKCLDRAEITELLPQVECVLQAAFALASSVHQLLEQFGAEKLQERYGAEGLEMIIRLDAVQQRSLASALADASSGRATLTRLKPNSATAGPPVPG
jgi:putative IMPACT (imprinted ancient) family translation regulator